jgi:PBP1b-binding outer membrane lipoprotein LpoB
MTFPSFSAALLWLCVGAAALLAGCQTNPPVPNATGVTSMEVDPGRKGPVSGVGIEGQDITAMVDTMIRDMASDPEVMRQGGTRPRIVVDSQCFVNESSQAINKNNITRRLDTLLRRAARGQFMFVSQENAAIIEKQRALKRSGTTDVGTRGMTRAQAGIDYQMCGSITSLDSRNVRTGMVQRMTQIFFKLVDVESGEVIWSNMYELNRAAADDVIYR